MDVVDRKILAILQDDGRMTVTELAKRVQLSVSATGERLRQLQTSGVIRRFAAIIDPAEVGRSIETLVDVRVGPSETKPWPELDQIIALDPYLAQAHSQKAQLLFESGDFVKARASVTRFLEMRAPTSSVTDPEIKPAFELREKCDRQIVEPRRG